jgi:hypothetical protein
MSRYSVTRAGGLDGAVFSGQILALRDGVAIIAALRVFEAGVADADFAGDLGSGFAGFDPMLDGLALIKASS